MKKKCYECKGKGLQSDTDVPNRWVECSRCNGSGEVPGDAGTWAVAGAALGAKVGVAGGPVGVVTGACFGACLGPWVGLVKGLFWDIRRG